MVREITFAPEALKNLFKRTWVQTAGPKIDGEDWTVGTLGKLE
jgi:hypothetical protein